MPEVINRFAGPHQFLSNFARWPVEYEGIEYPTNEHGFQAAKALDLEARARIAAAPTPADAKRMGQRVQLRPDWNTRVRYQVMNDLVRIKFSRPYLRRLLVATGDAELIEGNTWCDTHWGVCFCAWHKGKGANYLGRTLMGARRQLKEYV